MKRCVLLVDQEHNFVPLTKGINNRLYLLKESVEKNKQEKPN